MSAAAGDAGPGRWPEGDRRDAPPGEVAKERPPAPDPRRAYREALARHEAGREEARRRSLRLSAARAGTFLAAVAALVGADVLEAGAERAALVVAAALLAAFAAEVAVHRRIRRRESWAAALAAVAREGLLRLDRRWDELERALPGAESAEAPPPAGHPYARDLDVVGRASLVRLLGPVTSEGGRRLVRRWLLDPPDAAAARARSGAARELAGRAELRAEVTAHGRLSGPDRLGGLDAFLAWAEDASRPMEGRALRAAAWILPPLLTAAVLGDVVGGLPPLWLLPLAAQLEAYRRATRAVGADFRRAEAGLTPLRAYVPQLARLERERWEDPLLASLAERWVGGGEPAHRWLAYLAGILDSVASRRNLVYQALAPLLLLDVHLGRALDRWRDGHGDVVRGWLDALAEWEALSALGTLAHDHPDWCAPSFTLTGPPVLRAAGLGHPLLPDERCVRNDVEVGPPGTFLLVTGSNMSGKSTLLRALGANAVLAGAGAPACARALSLPPARVHAAMRVEDSLAEGVSTFMAELLRIRGIVEAADAPDPDGRPVLYLLDEILHGTNTAERRVAARGVLRHLLRSPAIGAASTHDLTLAGAPDLARAARAVHFREEVARSGDGTRLTFDYRLRPGPATTRNALRLLEVVGLGDIAREGETP